MSDEREISVKEAMVLTGVGRETARNRVLRVKNHLGLKGLRSPTVREYKEFYNIK